MLKKLQEKLNDIDYYKNHPHLRLLKPLLNRQYLWDLKNKKAVALGFAIGAFFAFLLPIFQFLFAGIFAVIFRANLPVSLVSTLITNPLTFVPIYIMALNVGNYILGFLGYEPIKIEDFSTFEFNMLGDLWTYLWLGLIVIGIVVSVVGYILIVLLHKNKKEEI